MAGRKTYLPRLLRLLRVLCQYLIKYENKIKPNLTNAGQAAYDAVVEACHNLEYIIDGTIVDGV